MNKREFSPMGKLIKHALVDCSMTATELASRLGTSQSHVSWNMSRRTGWDYARRVAEILNIPKEKMLLAWELNLPRNKNGGRYEEIS